MTHEISSESFRLSSRKNVQTRIEMADFSNSVDAAAIVNLLQHYASSIEGGGQPISSEVVAKLPGALAARSDTMFSLIAWDDATPIGLATCIEGFSTFAARPLINVHDLVVHSKHRGAGLAGKLLQRVSEIATQRGCCKVTLEVLEGNLPARKVYARCGFKNYVLDDSLGHAIFLQKLL